MAYDGAPADGSHYNYAPLGPDLPGWNGQRYIVCVAYDIVPRPVTFALFRRDRYGSGPTTDPPVRRGSGTPRTSAS